MFYERPLQGVTDQNAADASADVEAPRHLVRRMLHWLLPSPCLSCRREVWEPRGSLGLCPPCRDRLVRWPPDGCTVCGALITKARGGVCEDCSRHPPPFDRVLSTWCYQPPLDQVVTGLKFRRLDYLAEHLGCAMAAAHRGELAGRDLLVPVPLYWTRSLTRGFNQAELLARALARETGLPLVSALVRRRATRHQSRLGRDRRQHNLDGAFAPRRAGRLSRRHVLLVDDVTTTGATLRATAACLRRAGAASVVALTAARTPNESESSRMRSTGQG